MPSRRDLDPRLTKRFFEENTIIDYTAAQFTYVSMLTLMDSDFNEGVSDFVTPRLEEERKEDIQRELEMIDRAATPAEAVVLLKKARDPMNKTALCQKILGMGDEVIYLVIDRLKRSRYNIYIETAVLILAHADEKFVDELIRVFPEIQSPYARSEVCVLFAYRKRVDALPLIIDAYYQLQREMRGSDEDWEQGALLAIYKLCGIECI